MATPLETSPARRRFTDDILLDAALGAFDARGYRGAQMSDIAEAAGTTKPTLYARLGSKEQIYLRVLEREAELLKAQLIAAYERAASRPLHEMIHLATGAFFDFAAQRRAGFDLLFRSAPGGPGHGSGERAIDEVIDHVTELVRTATLRTGRAPGASTELLAAAGVGVAIKVCQYARDNHYDLATAETLATAFTEAAMRNIDLEAIAAVDRSSPRRGATRAVA